MIDGTDKIPSMNLQFTVVCSDSVKSMTYARNSPPEPISCGSVANCPRISAGADSDIKIGAIVAASPIAEPTKMRPIIRM
jgi:hypothetical protein